MSNTKQSSIIRKSADQKEDSISFVMQNAHELNNTMQRTDSVTRTERFDSVTNQLVQTYYGRINMSKMCKSFKRKNY